MVLTILHLIGSILLPMITIYASVILLLWSKFGSNKVQNISVIDKIAAFVLCVTTISDLLIYSFMHHPEVIVIVVTI